MPNTAPVSEAKVYVAVERGEKTAHRRLRTSEVKAVLSVSRALEAFTPEQRRRITTLTLYYDAAAHAWHPAAPGIPVRLEASAQRRGKRHYFVCPISGRRASKLYVVEAAFGHLIGSAKGLGLTYPSRALHKTPALDAAILSFRVAVRYTAHARAMQRDGERFRRALRRFVG